LNILISDFSSYKAIVIAKFIKKSYADVHIYGVDNKKFIGIFHSKYADKIFRLKSLNYIDEIIEIIRSKKINIFIPINYDEMNIYLPRREEFENSLDYWGSYDSFRTLNEKDRLYLLAKKINIKIPKQIDDIANLKPNYVIKPKKSSSARGVKYVFTKSDIKKYKNKYYADKNIIIQEYIQGIGVGYSLFSQNGKIIMGYGHKRLAEYPITGGSSVYRGPYENDEMKAIADKIITITKWSGFAMFEFKLTPRNQLYLIEINPRIWGSINQGLQNGVNYFIKLLGVPDYIKNNCKSNTYTYLSPLVYLSLVNYILRGEFKPILDFFKNFISNKPDINIFEDFKGWISTILRKIF